MMMTCSATGERMAQDDGTDRRWIILFLVAALILASSRWHFPRQSAGLKLLAYRTPMADLTLQRLGGGEWKLREQRGQVVMLNYWATWCEPCRDELPGLLRVARESGPNGLSVVGVSMDTAATAEARAQKVQQFITRYRVPYSIAFPDATWDVASRDISLPRTILVDRQGRIAKTYVGEVQYAVLTRDVAALLAER